MHRRWLSLPLLSSCASAFYPYHDRGEKSKRFYPFHEGEQKSQDGVVTIDIKKTERRDNTFSVVLSNPPTAPNALAISQDGSDYSYFSTIKFGSQQKEMYMLIDTGSANTWVMGSSCDSKSCAIHNTFGPADSTTLDATDEKWSLTYGTGEVSGVVASDTVSFADYQIQMGFGVADTASDDFSNYPMDGILGLGRATSNLLGTPTIMDVLDKQAQLKENVVGIHLHRASDGTKDGQLTFGGVDTSKFSGQLSYTPTLNAASWEIKADDAIVDGQACNFTGKSAIIDTGTTYLLMPPPDAQTLHALIPGSAHNGETFTVPCDTEVSVEFAFSGQSYSISPQDYVGRQSGNVCNSNIIGHQAFGPDEWILGDVFLKNVYAVFDFDQSRIGFGSPGSGGSIAASSSSSSSISGESSESSTTMAPSTTARSSSGTSTATASPTASSTVDSSPFDNSSSVRETSRIMLVMMVAFIVGLIS